MALNRVVLMGRICNDLELKRTNSGKGVVSFTIACDRYSTSEEKKTDFIDCTAWGQTAEFVCRNFGKGRNIAVEGKLQIREWQDQSGNKRRNAEIVVDNVFFADSKPQEKQTNFAQKPQFVPVDEMDGDLPF